MVAARCVDDDKHPAKSVHPNSDEALFSFGVRIFNRDSKWITKRLLRMSEADLVLAKVDSRLGGVELDIHRIVIMHILCIASIGARDLT